MKGIAIRKNLTDPVALIHWRSRVPQVALLDERHRPAVESLLSAEIKNWSFRIVREKNEATGEIFLAQRTLQTESAEFLGCVATRLTFSPLNGENFVATVEREMESSFSQGGQKDPLATNLFLEASSPNSILVSCGCGVSIVAFEARCDACKRSNPLGIWLRRKGPKFRSIFVNIVASELRSALSVPTIEKIRDALEHCVRSFEDTSALPNEKDDRKASLRKMLDYHKRLFQISCFSSDDIANLKNELRRSTGHANRTLMGVAEKARTSWNGSPSAGWKAAADFSSTLTATLHRVWSEPLRVTRKSALDLVQCAGGFSRFAAKWQEELDHEFDYWDAAKWGWRAFRAWASFGVSELVKFGVGLLKSSRDKEAWERFAATLTASVETAGSASDLIGEAFLAQDQLAHQLAEGLHSHLFGMFAADYSTVHSTSRKELTHRLSHLLSTLEEQADSKNGSGRWWYGTLGVVLLVALALVVLLVIYLRFVVSP